MTEDDLRNRFDFHAADTVAKEVHGSVRSACLNAAWVLNEVCPEGREKSLAITKLEEAMMWANAAIARQ